MHRGVHKAILRDVWIESTHQVPKVAQCFLVGFVLRFSFVPLRRGIEGTYFTGDLFSNFKINLFTFDVAIRLNGVFEDPRHLLGRKRKLAADLQCFLQTWVKAIALAAD